MTNFMHCNQAQQLLEDYLDGLLDESQKDAICRHVADCECCHESLERENKFRGLLRQYPVETPEPSFAVQAFSRARKQQNKAPRLGVLAGFTTGAIAASLLAWLTAGLFMQVIDQGIDRDDATPNVTFKLNEVKNIHLVFNATQDFPDATIALYLPSHLELERYRGRRELVWKSDIDKGSNTLILPVIALAPVTGEFTAKVTFGDREKTFVIKHEVQPAGMEPADMFEPIQTNNSLI